MIDLPSDIYTCKVLFAFDLWEIQLPEFTPQGVTIYRSELPKIHTLGKVCVCFPFIKTAC